MGKSQKFVGDPRIATAVAGAAVGFPIAVYGANTGDHVVTTLGLFFALIPFFIVEMLEIRDARENFRAGQNDVRIRLDRIDTYLKASNPDKLKIAIFTDLLIYLPVYVADAAGYFEQEGIEVDYLIKHGDKEVADAVRSFEADIGLCDPCMCARAEFSRPGDNLLVLSPLVTKSAARPVTRHELRIRTRLLSGGEISIATYGAPSTTFVMAVNLMDEMKGSIEAKGTPQVKFNLEQIAESEFSADKLNNLLEKYELVMLWEPLLSLAKTSPENIEFQLDSSSVLPNDIMYSALVISCRLLEERPTLGIRLFRALSRATYQIHLAAKNDKLMSEVLGAAKNRRTMPLEDSRLRSLLQDMVERDRLFPLVSSPEQLYEDPEWKEQLHKALEYRLKAEKARPSDFKGDPRHSISIEDCRRFFCPPEGFKAAQPSKTGK